MKPHISDRSRVMQYLIDNEDTLLESETIAVALNLTLKQVAQHMYSICSAADSVIKQKRGVWIYNPSEPVVKELPLVHRFRALLQKGDLSRDDIAKELNLSSKEVTALAARIRRELGVKVHSTLVYSIKEPTDD